MPDKLHILFLSSWYPNRIQPTLGNFVQKHAEAVARMHKVSALHVVSDPALNSSYDVVRNKINEVDTWNIYFRPSGNPLLHGLRYFFAHRLGWKLIRANSGKPQLVHHNILFPAGIFALYLRYFHSLKYLVTENWTGYLPEHHDAYSGRLRKWITRLIANNAAFLTPVSKNLSSAMQSHGFSAPHEVVYNVVDTDCFIPGKEEGVFTFLHISTLVDEHKNISGMLRVLKRLKTTGQKFRMVIAGDGDHRKYEAMAGREGLEDITEFGGEMNTAEVAGRMKKAHCFVLFSNYENLPCVMVEAMSAGLPVIVTRVGGMPEHVNFRNGRIVEARDEEGLFSAMKEMLEQAAIMNHHAIREYALQHFSYTAVGKRFSDLYQKMLS